jgi:hypothetical protein
MSMAIGNRLDIDVLTHGRAALAEDAREHAQRILDSLDIGLRVKRVIVQDVSPPPHTQNAYHEVNTASQDVENLINQAERQYHSNIQRAYGEADELLNRAAAYQIEIVNRAKGEASRFSAVAAEYRKAPEVTRDRLFLESMESVFKAVPYTVVDKDVQGLLPLLGGARRQSPMAEVVPVTPRHGPSSTVEAVHRHSGMPGAASQAAQLPVSAPANLPQSAQGQGQGSGAEPAAAQQMAAELLHSSGGAQP